MNVPVCRDDDSQGFRCAYSFTLRLSTMSTPRGTSQNPWLPQKKLRFGRRTLGYALAFLFSFLFFSRDCYYSCGERTMYVMVASTFCDARVWNCMDSDRVWILKFNQESWLMQMYGEALSCLH